MADAGHASTGVHSGNAVSVGIARGTESGRSSTGLALGTTFFTGACKVGVVEFIVSFGAGTDGACEVAVSCRVAGEARRRVIASETSWGTG